MRLTPQTEARILDATRRAPTDGSTHWSTRSSRPSWGSAICGSRGCGRSTGLKPHRLEGYLASNDPDFESQGGRCDRPVSASAAARGRVLRGREDRDSGARSQRPGVALSPGHAERHGFEYVRHGTLSLYAAFNTKTGEVIGQDAPRHTSAEFVAFLTDIVTHQPNGKEIHVIADNLSAHKTARVEAFLAQYPRVHLHFTPTYSSWLNQVELWFAKIERDVIARGIFTSVPDLKRKLMRYIRHYNTQPKP
jgi:transposase